MDEKKSKGQKLMESLSYKKKNFFEISSEKEIKEMPNYFSDYDTTVHFIDMEEKEDQELLMKTLAVQCARDPVKTTVVDMTRLNLVEITRKKIRKPLHEQVRLFGR